MENKIIIILAGVCFVFVVLSVLFIALYATKDDDEDGTTKFEKQEESIISSSGEKIYGILYLPKKKNSNTVILCHGFGGTHEDMVPYAEYLAKYGYVTYVFDFRGGSPKSKSEGSTTKMTPLTEKNDLSDVYEYLIKQDYVKTGKVYIIGNSQGGFVSSMYAAENKDKVAGLLLLFPALVIPDNARDLYSDKNSIPDTIDFMGMTISKEYYLSIYDMNAYT